MRRLAFIFFAGFVNLFASSCPSYGIRLGCPVPLSPMPQLPVPAKLPPASGACKGAPSPAPVSGYLPITIVNNSGLDAEDVYVCVLVNTLTQYLSFSESAGHMVASIKDFTPNTYLSDAEYSYSLSTFENIKGDEYVFYIPNTGNSSVAGSPVMKSSRIMLSLKQPLTYFINNSRALLSPSEFDVKNDNYFVLHDKVEFDVGSNGHNRMTLNLTGVDFFGLPVLLQADYNYLYGGAYFETCGVTGMPKSVGLADVFGGYRNALKGLVSPFDKIWGGLAATFRNPAPAQNECILRVFAPATAMGSTQTQANPSAITFPKNYFLDSVFTPDSCTWLAAVWQSKPGKAPAFYQNTNPKQPSLILSADTDAGTGYATGREDQNGNFQFVITGTGSSPNPDSGKTVTFPKPTSTKAFFTGAIADYQPAVKTTASAATNAQLLKGFATSIIAGFLPFDCSTNPQTVIDATFIRNHSANYFQNNAILKSKLGACACVDNTPWYDFYSRVLLTIGAPNLFYTSAYSDYLGTDGTMTITSLSDHNTEAKVAIYIGDCTTGVNIPDPYADTATYSVTLGVPTVTRVSYSITGKDGTYIPYSSGTFNAPGDKFWVKVEYTSGIYNGKTYLSQVAPCAEIFHPILPGGGNVTTSGSNTTVAIGASP